MKEINKMTMTIPSKSSNEAFGRIAVSAFIAQTDPTLDIMTDIKTAVSEAVTNCIVHAYKEKMGNIYITVKIFDNNTARIIIRDRGCGIEDIEKAKEPLYTTAGEERAGLGFAVMESFMDKLTVKSQVGKGTKIIMEKHLCGK